MRFRIVYLVMAVSLLFGCAKFLAPEEDLAQKNWEINSEVNHASKNDLKIALVLSGGAARGLAHIGVIKVLEEEGIHADIVVGTSMGSIIGAMYASGMNSSKIQEFASRAMRGSYRLMNIFIFSKDRLGLLDFSPFRRVFSELLPYKNIEEMPLKFAAVATDLNSGELVIFTKGSIDTAITASSAVPGVFNPVQLDGHWLVDGGLINNLPADIARNMGAEMVIAVNVMKGTGDFYPEGYLDVLLGTLHVIMNATGRHNEDKADVLINPSIDKINAVDFRPSNLDFLILEGETATRKAIPEIKQKLSSISRLKTAR